jgi:hypothetical protein
MKPIPDKVPSGRRIMSARTIDMCVSAVLITSQLAWIIAAVAATDTRIVVRWPAGWAGSPRSGPTRKPAKKPSARRSRASAQERVGLMESAPETPLIRERVPPLR